MSLFIVRSHNGSTRKILAESYEKAYDALKVIGWSADDVVQVIKTNPDPSYILGGHDVVEQDRYCGAI